MSVVVNVRKVEEEQMREELANKAPWAGRPLWLVKNSRIDDSISGIREACWNSKIQTCTEVSKIIINFS